MSARRRCRDKASPDTFRGTYGGYCLRVQAARHEAAHKARKGRPAYGDVRREKQGIPRESGLAHTYRTHRSRCREIRCAGYCARYDRDNNYAPAVGSCIPRTHRRIVGSDPPPTRAILSPISQRLRLYSRPP